MKNIKYYTLSLKYYTLSLLCILGFHSSSFSMEPIHPQVLNQRQRAALGPLISKKFQMARTQNDRLYSLALAFKMQSNNVRNRQIIEEILIKMNFNPTITNINNFIKTYIKEYYVQQLNNMHQEERVEFLENRILVTQVAASRRDPEGLITLEVLQDLLAKIQYKGRDD